MSRRSTTTSTLRTAATKDPAADASMRILSGHRRAAAAPSNLPPRRAASQGDSSLDRPAGCQPGRADSTEHPPPTARKAPPRGASPTPPSREQQRACTSIGFALGNDDSDQAAGPPVARASAWRQKRERRTGPAPVSSWTKSNRRARPLLALRRDAFVPRSRLIGGMSRSGGGAGLEPIWSPPSAPIEGRGAAGPPALAGVLGG